MLLTRRVRPWVGGAEAAGLGEVDVDRDAVTGNDDRADAVIGDNVVVGGVTRRGLAEAA